MPNHVYQRLVVVGKTQAELNEFIAFSAPTNPSNHGVLDHEKFLPMPPEIRHLRSPIQIVSNHEYILYQESEERSLAEKMGLGGPLTQAMLEDYVKRFGTADWYAWATTNWGTKWGIYDCGPKWTHPETVNWDFVKTQPQLPQEGCPIISVCFQSAWSTIRQIAIAMSNQFPQLLFILSADDEGGNFTHRYTIYAGNSLQLDISPDRKEVQLEVGSYDPELGPYDSDSEDEP